MCHVAITYVIANRIIELYTCLALFNITPHIETIIIDNALYYDFILILTSLI